MKNWTLYIENTNGMTYNFKVTQSEGYRMIQDIKAGMRANWMCVERAILKDGKGRHTFTATREIHG